MNKMIKIRLTVFLIIFVFVLKLSAQETLLDPDVRTGVLENGMTYYILHNEEPKGKADFYIAHNVGAMQEEDDQNGLAHMLEHLAFNGSTNFKGKGIKNFLESQGVSFGGNINAYTSFDETVYTVMNVPTENPVVMDSCIWILHDWSGSLTLAEEEIMAERGVINEEWRQGDNANRRMQKKLADVTFYESKYAKRDIIGDMDIVNSSPSSAIRRFYEMWYRPELQAAIIVGDVDVDEMEERVKRILSKIPKTVNGEERIVFPVAKNKEFLYKYATDEEATGVNYSLSIKHDPVPIDQKGEDYFRTQMVSGLIAAIFRERLGNISRKPGAPFNRAQVGYFSYVRSMDVFGVFGSKPLDTDLKDSFLSLMVEVERVVRHGVTESELERTKNIMLQGLEMRAKNKDNIQNTKLTKGLVSYYTTREPFMDPIDQYELAKKTLGEINSTDIHEFVIDKYTEENRVITITGPVDVDFEYPTREEITSMLTELKGMKIEPFVDKVLNKPFLSKEPVSGKVVSQKKLDGLDATEYTLSNGAKVVLYSTEFDPTTISFQAISKGGMSLLSTEDLPTFSIVTRVADNSGIAEHSLEDVRKFMAGKSFGVTPFMDDYSEGLRGSSSIEDFEMLLQYAYMFFEMPRFDKEPFENIVEQNRMRNKMTLKDNKRVFNEAVQAAMSNGHDRKPVWNEEFINNMRFDRVEPIYKDRISNAGDFVFVFVGPIVEEDALPLIEKYIGAISDNARREEWKDHGVRPVSDGYENIFKREMETPKQTNNILYHGESDGSAKSRIVIQIAGRILGQRYFERVREEEGGSYGVRTRGYLALKPSPRYFINMTFDCNPDMSDKLLSIIHEEVAALAKNGPSDDEFNKVVESMRSNRKSDLEENGVYMRGILDLYDKGYNSALPENFEDILNNMTKNDFAKSFKKMVRNSEKLSVIMQPER